MTLQEIGDEIHVSRERIRQLERKALKKLHKRIYGKLPKNPYTSSVYQQGRELSKSQIDKIVDVYSRERSVYITAKQTCHKYDTVKKYLRISGIKISKSKRS